jgi:hypothetical protein
MKPMINMFSRAAAMLALSSIAMADGANYVGTSKDGLSKIWSSETAAAVATKPESVIYDEASAMAWFRTLGGEWDQTKADGTKIPDIGEKMSFKVIGAGSTVMQSILPDTPREMTVMFHMDGPNKLLLDHFCAARNVPHMVFQKSDKPGEIIFKFAGGTNLNPKVDYFVHNQVYHIISKDAYVVQAATSGKGTLIEGDPIYNKRRGASMAAVQ